MAKTFVFLCAFLLLGVTSGQHPSHLRSIKEDTNLRVDYMQFKDLIEEVKSLKEEVNELKFLKEEMKELKSKIHQQDLLLASYASLPTQDHHQLDKTNMLNTVGSKGGMPRSCHEARLADPSLPTDVYWIDPDGQGVGEDPIQVNCDMSTGTTFIGHNSEAATSVGHCTDPGCYSKPISYEASSRQIAALSQISTDCRQMIKYECYSAPLEFEGIQYSWWNDRNGKPQYYWHGNNNATHTCQCGIGNNCVDNTKKCNCDAMVPADLKDEGEITAKESLPVTSLHFGRTTPAASIGIHTLGKLKCSGQKSVVGMPTSCVELWQIGHVLSGLYLIKGVHQVETVFCDFSKPSTDSGFQMFIGYADVKSYPVYFYAQRMTDFTSVNSVIPFDKFQLNVGNVMSSAGIFTAPRPGKYFFSFSSISNNNAYGRVDLQHKKTGTSDWLEIAQAFGKQSVGTLTLQSTLQLTNGDQIRLILSEGGINGDNNGSPQTHFVGWLIEEDIF